MSVEEVVDSVRNIVSRWSATRSSITSSVSIGDTVIEVDTTKRFESGDEIMIRSPQTAETPLYIDEILDSTHIKLTTAAQFEWPLSVNPIVEKTFKQMFVQNVYMGDPDVIPKFPAIAVMATDSSSEWLTLDSTKETYNVKIMIYVQAANQEDGYRFLLRLTDTIKRGLKNNFFPLVGPYDTTAVTANIAPGDEFVKVADSSIFSNPNNQRILLEDNFKSEEFIIDEVVDATTVKLSKPVCFEYLSVDGTKIINPKRFIYNSWPASIEYGTIFKGTLLKAATINWFAWEEQWRTEQPIDPSLT